MGAMMQQSASQTVGPFFRIGLIYSKAQSNLVNENTSGERIMLTGVVFDGDGQPIPDALIEIWQPDSNGIFNHPLDPLQEQADPHFHGFGRAGAGAGAAGGRGDGRPRSRPVRAHRG